MLTFFRLMFCIVFIFMYFTNFDRLLRQLWKSEDLFWLIWGVWSERCVHKYRCYYWNINNCLLGIINKSRSRILVYVISQRYLSYGWYLQSAWCFKNCKPHPSGTPGRPKQTNPNIWNGHNGAVSLLTHSLYRPSLIRCWCAKKYMTVQNLICDQC